MSSDDYLKLLFKAEDALENAPTSPVCSEEMICHIAWQRAAGRRVARDLVKARIALNALKTFFPSPAGDEDPDMYVWSRFFKAPKSIPRSEFSKSLSCLEAATHKELSLLDSIFADTSDIKTRTKAWHVMQFLDPQAVRLEVICAYITVNQAAENAWSCGCEDEKNYFNCNKRLWVLLNNFTKALLFLSPHGVMSGDFIHSTYDHGPSYNILDERGIPVPGAYVAPGDRIYVSAENDYGAYVPNPGIVSISGITGHPDGTISFSTVAMGDRPALLVPEDFNVVLTLVFAEATVPKFSLNRNFRDEPTPNRLIDAINHKWYNPEWLRHTDFGRTMYATDMFMGDLAWCADLPKVITPNQLGTNGSIVSLAEQFNDTLKESKISLPKFPDEYNFMAFRLMAPPNLTPFFEIATNSNGSRSIVNLGMPIRIRGWVGNNNEDNARINDKTHYTGSIANYFTSEFDTLATLLPCSLYMSVYDNL